MATKTTFPLQPTSKTDIGWIIFNGGHWVDLTRLRPLAQILQIGRFSSPNRQYLLSSGLVDEITEMLKEELNTTPQ